MIIELGHFALALALIVALVQSTMPLLGAARGNAAWMAMAEPAALTQFLLCALAFGALTHAYIVSDFSVIGVAENSHTVKPLLYKISGVWGNHEGSMVLWVLVLSLFGAAVAAFGNNLPPTLKARTLAIQAMIGVGFIAFVLFTSNPFTRLDPAPIEGNGLNPLLQDPVRSTPTNYPSRCLASGRSTPPRSRAAPSAPKLNRRGLLKVLRLQTRTPPRTRHSRDKAWVDGTRALGLAAAGSGHCPRWVQDQAV